MKKNKGVKKHSITLADAMMHFTKPTPPPDRH